MYNYKKQVDLWASLFTISLVLGLTVRPSSILCFVLRTLHVQNFVSLQTAIPTAH